MTSIAWISAHDPPEAFPPVAAALEHPNGLLAGGGDLSVERLLYAYRRGIFPWYEHGQPILWWSPEPRAVLRPPELRVSRSLRRALKKGLFRVTADTAFANVIRACAAPRRYTSGTWITAEMVEAFERLHGLGWAHSFEAWQDGALAGGLYGVAIGRVFFGESMFSRVSDASKVAFVHAVRYLQARNYALIDCQIRSRHMESLGAKSLPRRTFLDLLAEHCDPPASPGSWAADLEQHTAT